MAQLRRLAEASRKQTDIQTSAAVCAFQREREWPRQPAQFIKQEVVQQPIYVNLYRWRFSPEHIQLYVVATQHRTSEKSDCTMIFCQQAYEKPINNVADSLPSGCPKSMRPKCDYISLNVVNYGGFLIQSA